MRPLVVQAGSVLGFGAFGLSVTAERVEAGELVVEVESLGGQEVFCAACGTRARSKGRRRVVLRDAEAAGSVPVRVLWNKRIWACFDSGCESGTWTEQSGLAGSRRVLTRRAGEWAAGRLAAAGGSVAGLARKLGVGRQTMWEAIAPIMLEAVEHPGRVAAPARVGVDETVMGLATRRRRRRFVSAAVDADTGQVLDVFDGRDAAGLQRWALQQPRELMAAVEVVCLDPHEGYRKAVHRLKDLGVLGPGVRVAADPSPHRALGEPGARRPPPNPKRNHRTPGPQRRPAPRGPQAAPQRLRAARRPRLGPPPPGAPRRRPLRRGRRLPGGQGEDPLGVPSRRPRPGRRPIGRRHRLLRSPRGSPRAAPPRRTLNRWRTEIETSISTGAHNARTETANAKTKDIKRSGRGYANLANYRLRILLAAGQKPGHTQPITKTRTRHPRSKA